LDLLDHLQHGYELHLGDGKADKGDWEPEENAESVQLHRWKRSKPDYYYMKLSP
jgi:hypothetical protein